MDCLFCKIVSGEIPAEIVPSHAVRVRDWWARAAGGTFPAVGLDRT